MTPFYIWETATGVVKTSGALDLTAEEIAAQYPAPAGCELVIMEKGSSQPHPLQHKIVDGAITDLPPAPMQLPIVEKLNALRTDAYTSICAGFVSTALSDEGKTPPDGYRYPSDETSQRNALVGGMLMCMDPTGAWARRPHTESQRAQVVTDFTTFRDTQLTKLDTLRAAASVATTQAELDAVTWKDDHVKP